MASFVQTASSASAAQQPKRQLYNITRSEATWLVRTFINAIEKSMNGSIEPYRVFRDALETQKPAYLGKFNNSRDPAAQGTFYAMALHIYGVIERLFKQAANLNHDAKVTALCKQLPTSESIAYNSIACLNWAVYNWHYKNETINEELTDNYFETTTCAICDFTGQAMFYFSTAYGLEQPVCEQCLPFDDSCDDTKKDGEYVVSEEEEESEEEASEDEESEEEASEEEASEDEESEAEEEASEADDISDDDSDYNVEDDECEDSDSDASSNYTEETDLSDDEEASEADEKTFGCDGCNYEWRDGWRLGWKAAMKHIRNYANEKKSNQPDAPRCATCDVSHGDLKKCSGHCGGSVRYCSEKCQREDWSEHKRVCRR